VSTRRLRVNGHDVDVEVVPGDTLLRDTPNPDERTIREQMSGNICRCTGYTQIVDAVLIAARKQPAPRAEPVASTVASEAE
jgi:carbon-monoxide dehydrogenase small subunit